MTPSTRCISFGCTEKQRTDGERTHHAAETEQQELIAIRQGKYSLTEIQELGGQLESEALAAQATSRLPDEVDRDAISEIIADTQLRFWHSQGIADSPLAHDRHGAKY